jgi:hypothetical protein
MERALDPKSESFVDRVIQNDDTKATVRAALDGTPISRMIDFILTP